MIVPLSCFGVDHLGFVVTHTPLCAFSAVLDKPGKMSHRFVTVCSTNILLRLKPFQGVGRLLNYDISFIYSFNRSLLCQALGL